MLDLPLYQTPPPDFSKVAPAPPPLPGVIMGGLKSGGYGMLGALAGAASGAAKLVGADQASQSLGQSAAQYTQDAQTVGRPDIDQQGWTGGGVGGFFKKLGYTAAQAVPSIVGAGALGAAAVAALPEEAVIGTGVGVAGAAGRLGAALPTWLGGAGGAAGASAAELASGARLAAGIGGAAGVMVPQSFGEQVNAAAEQPGGLTRGAALRAAVQAVPAGLAQSIVPAEGALLRGTGRGMLGQLSGALGDNIAARFAEHGITNAAAGAVGAGAQTAADLSFDPTMSASDKASAILHAAGQGAIGSGLIGGAFGLFGKPGAKDIEQHVDATLDANGFSAGKPVEPGPPPTSEGTPTPPPFGRRKVVPGTEPEPVPQELPLETPPEGIPGTQGIQYDLFNPRPYYPGMAPPRTDDALMAQLAEIRGAPAPVAPEAAKPEKGVPQSVEDLLKPENAPPPPNAAALQALKSAKVSLRGQGTSFKKLIENSGATNLAEFYKELSAVPTDSPVAQSKGFVQLADRLGISEPDLDAKLAAAKANPKTTPKQLATLNFQLGLRDAARALPEAGAAPVEAPAPAAAVQTSPLAAVQAPDDISVPDIPERHPVDAATTPAVTQTADAARAAERASPDIQTLGPAVTEPAPADTSTAPKSIAEKVIDAARAAVGAKGGEVDVASLRAALPDVAPKDLENALREIHTDDTEHTLTQNPKGQRTGVDGVTVSGQGKFHKLELAPQEGADAVQVGSAAPQAVGDQPQGGSGVRSGDTAGDQVARAAEILTEAGPSGAQEPADQGAAQAAVTPEQAAAWANSRPVTDADFAAELQRPPITQTVGMAETSPGIFRLTYDGKVQGDSGGMSRAAAMAKIQEQTTKRSFDTATRRPIAFAADSKLIEPEAADEPFVPASMRDQDQSKIEAIQATLKKVPEQGLWTGHFASKAAGNKEAASAYARELHDRLPSGQYPSTHEYMQQEIRFNNTAATEAKIAPQDPTVRSPEQAVQTAAKQAATENLLTAPPSAKAAADGVTKKLRRQTRNTTAMVETPNGDQTPTAAVGGDLHELAQASATSADPIQPAAPAEPMAKMPHDRVAGVVGAVPTLPREQVDAHVAKIVGKLREDVRSKVHVIDGPEGLPQHIQDAAAATGHDLSEIPALNYNGEVYLHANQMRNLGEVEDALAHEVFGHMGTAQRFNGASTYQSAMSKVFDRTGGLEGIEKLARERGVWAKGDDGRKLRGGAGLKAYFPGEDMPVTPQLKARIMDELIAHVAAAKPSALDEAIMSVQDLAKKGIINVLRRGGLHNFARRFDTFTQTELSKWVADSRKALAEPPKPGDVDLAAGASDPRLFLHDSDPIGEPPFLAKIGAQQRDYQGLFGLMGSLRDHLMNNVAMKDLFGERMFEPGVKGPTTPERLAGVGRLFVENIAPAVHIATEGARVGMKGLMDHFLVKANVQQPLETHLQGMASPVTQAHMDLRGQDRVQADRLEKVMDIATSNNVDPTRPWSAHSWLNDLPPEEVEARRKMHAVAQEEFNKLGMPGKGHKITNGQQVYKDHVALSQTMFNMPRATLMHDILSTVFKDDAQLPYNPSLRYAGQDPTYVDASGRNLAEDHFRNINASNAYWAKAFNDMHQIASTLLTENGTKPDNVGSTPYAELAKIVQGNDEGTKGYTQQGPYFRRGRTGDFTVSFKIKPQIDANGNPTGRPDPDALKAIQETYGKDFPQVSIGSSDGNNSLFARFPSESTAQSFAAKVQDGGELRKHIDQEHGTRVAKISDGTAHDSAVPFMKELVDAATAKFNAQLERMDPGSESYKVVAKERDKVVGNLRASIMDLSGDNSVRSIQSRRENVQGSNADMLENQTGMAQSVSRSVAQTATRTMKADAIEAALQNIRETTRSQSQKALGEAARKQRIFDAYMSRNEAADVRVDNNFLSWVKQGMHAFTLGASPAYVVLNMSQLPTLGLPELAKFHGYGKSASAMISATGDAFKVIRAMIQSGTITDGGITKAVLDKANLGDARNYLSTLANHDHLELGAYSTVNSGLQLGSLGRTQRFLRFANSTAVLSETLGRLVMAFAAKRLYDNMPEGQSKASLQRQFASAEDYGGHVIAESMLRWGNYNTPKLFTAGGAFGKAGPVISQFHGWTPRLVAKLYQEMADGFTGRLGTGPEADQMRQESRRFALGHVAAVTALSGSLGLPFAGYAAGAATRLSGLTGNEPFDFEGHYRTWLADTFGKDAGVIIARGLPRYLGTDMSQLGDDNFAPLAKLMEDRRKLEDAFPDYLAHAWGSAPGAMLNFLLGARELTEGRFSEAGARALPTALRNLVRAYRVNEYGYTSATGEPLPVQSGPAEVLKTALGLQPGELADEKERQASLGGLRGDRQYSSSLIKRDYLIAMSRGDQAGMQAAMDRARKFDRDNPGQKLTSSFQGLIVSRAKAVAYSNQTHTLGVMPTDVRAREITSY